MRRSVAVVALLALALVTSPAATATAAALPIPAAAAAPLRVTMSELPTLGGEDTRVSGVNDSGQAIGSSQRPDGTVHAVLWQDGELRELLPDWAFSSADAINNAGQVLITGQRVTDGPTEHGSLPGAAMSVTDANGCGQIIGSTLVRTPDGVVRGGFVWSHGQFVDLGAAVGVSPTVGVELIDLSGKGRIIGSILTISDPGSESIHQTNRPVLWTID